MTAARIHIIGAGPAGSAAAIAASLEGSCVQIYERSFTPHHKVCGEFLPAEACMVLERLGAWSGFLRLGAAAIRRCILHWGCRSKEWRLDDPAYSLSRFELDRLLLQRALDMGSDLTRGHSVNPSELAGGLCVVAHGRRTPAPRSRRLFGFKAHFEGPVDDSVELHFTRAGYIGISPVEGGRTNVCGLAPEHVLARYGFDVDEFLETQPALARRLAPLSRCMPWLRTGPLVFSSIPAASGLGPSAYAAGDALSFVDPFTGSGILNALITGSQAGLAAARHLPVEHYLRSCRRMLNAPFGVSSLFRLLLRAGLGGLALGVPGAWLYRATRPSPMGVLDV